MQHRIPFAFFAAGARCWVLFCKVIFQLHEAENTLFARAAPAQMKDLVCFFVKLHDVGLFFRLPKTMEIKLYPYVENFNETLFMLLTLLWKTVWNTFSTLSLHMFVIPKILSRYCKFSGDLKYHCVHWVDVKVVSECDSCIVIILKIYFHMLNHLFK